MYTVETVKKELPEIKVKFPNGKIVSGVVSGRENRFCIVSVKIYDAWLTVGEWSWDSVTNCLNKNRPLSI